MQALTYSYARANLAQTMSDAVNNRQPILITRSKGENCVLLAQSDYDALQETAYLLRHPINAQHLAESLAQLQSGQDVHAFRLPENA